MAVYELDPHCFLPDGHQIIDGGPTRLPRTFVTPAVRPARTHENFMVEEVMHPPRRLQWGLSGNKSSTSCMAVEFMFDLLSLGFL